MILPLLKLFRSYNKGKGGEGMNEFANDQIADIILAPFWIAILLLAPMLILSGALGFFHLWGGPYGIARFFFWFFAVIAALIVMIMRSIISRTKKIVKRGMEYTKSKIIN